MGLDDEPADQSGRVTSRFPTAPLTRPRAGAQIRPAKEIPARGLRGRQRSRPRAARRSLEPDPVRTGVGMAVDSRVRSPSPPERTTRGERDVRIQVIGAGVVGLTAGLRTGASRRRCRTGRTPRRGRASAARIYAGGMISPWCERQAAEPIVTELGRRGAAISGPKIAAGRHDRGQPGRRPARGTEPDVVGFASAQANSRNATAADRRDRARPRRPLSLRRSIFRRKRISSRATPPPRSARRSPPCRTSTLRYSTEANGETNVRLDARLPRLRREAAIAAICAA